MMIASPTAASAAATVITKKTNTCPADAVRLRERDEAQVHRVEHQLDAHEHDDRVAADQHAEHADREQHRARRTAPQPACCPPLLALLAEHHRADDRGEQQDARHLERQQIFVEQRRRDRRDRAGLRRSASPRSPAGSVSVSAVFALRQREDLRENRDADRAGRRASSPSPRMSPLDAAARGSAA